MYTIRRPPECLLNNVIDKDIQAALRPFNIVQKIFLLSNFTIISNFITPNFAVFHFKSVIGALILMLACLFRYIIDSNMLVAVEAPILSRIILCIDCILIIISCTMLYIVNVIQSSNFVLLILKLQYIINVINLDRDKILFNLKLRNWICVTSIIILYIILISLGTSYIQMGLFRELSITVPVFLFEFQILFVSRLVQMLSEVLSLWRSKMLIHINVHYNLTHPLVNEDDLLGNKMVNAYKNIINAFHLIEKIFCSAVSTY